MNSITIKDLFNSLSPEVQDEVKFTYAQLLEKTGEYDDNIEDIALSILSSSNSPVNGSKKKNVIKKFFFGIIQNVQIPNEDSTNGGITYKKH